MRFRRPLVLAAIAAIVTLGALSPAAMALPPIHVEVPHVEVPRSVRPLTELDWEQRTAAYQERLGAAGSEEALAAEETARRTESQDFDEAFRNCVRDAVERAIEDHNDAITAGQDANTEDDLRSGLLGCLESAVPEGVPDALEALAASASTQAAPSVAGVTPTSSQTVDVPISFDGGSGTSAVPVAAADPPADSGGGFPWLLAVLVAAGLGGAALVAAARRSG